MCFCRQLARLSWCVCAACLWLLRGSPAWAHDVKATVLLVDIAQTVAVVELQIPPDQLELVLFEASSESAAVSAYVARHLAATTFEGRPFLVNVTGAQRRWVADGETVVVEAELTAPAGANARRLELFYDGVSHRVVTHDVRVYLRRDLQSGRLGQAPEPLGLLHYQKKTLAIDRSSGSSWQAFTTVFSLGLRHVADGADHLLFLLMLLLPAALSREGKRWSSRGHARGYLRHTIALVTAFTVGHSLTLAIGTLYVIPLPSRLVEVLVAASILISAAHAARPIFPGKEAWIAAGFGLVHGFSFASGLTGIGLDRPTLIQSLLGFNLGVEAFQLLIVLLTLPCLLLLSRRSSFGALRVALAIFGGVAALAWIFERGFSLRTPLVPALESVAGYFPALLGLLAAVSLFLTFKAERATTP